VSSLAEYFPKGDTLIVVDEPVRLKEHSDMTFYEYSESMKNRLESGYVLPSQTHMFMDMEAFTYLIPSDEGKAKV
jgi:transcription-repair coupling factor (superfamily II helicase)